MGFVIFMIIVVLVSLLIDNHKENKIKEEQREKYRRGEL